MLGKLGMTTTTSFTDAYLKNEIPVAGCAHQAGTCRFGTDPSTSVLNADCKAHELDNLYVVDTSFFPSISAVNPALTAMANALRVGDHLLERLGESQTARPERNDPARLQTVDLARIQFATTSLYHFLFVPLTLGLAPLVAVMQTLWYRSGDEAWLKLTNSSGR